MVINFMVTFQVEHRGILPASMNDIPLDFRTLEEYGCFIGSAAVVILSDKDKARDAARTTIDFQTQSCGKCTPCRAGTSKASELMKEADWDTDLLND